MSVPGLPSRGLQTVEQNVATDIVTFYAEQKGLAIARALLSSHLSWTSVAKEERSRAVSRRRSSHVFGLLTHTVAKHTEDAARAQGVTFETIHAHLNRYLCKRGAPSTLPTDQFFYQAASIERRTEENTK